MDAIGWLFAGGFGGGLIMRIVDYLVERKMFEQTTEKAEKMVPDFLEKPLGKALDQVAEELKDTSNQTDK